MGNTLDFDGVVFSIKLYNCTVGVILGPSLMLNGRILLEARMVLEALTDKVGISISEEGRLALVTHILLN